MRKPVVVIGGGFGGMAAALRLRARGEQVILLERQSRLGGRAQCFERDGFRHDAGPTVVTAPHLFEELFALFGRDPRDYIRFRALDTWYSFRFADGERFSYGADLDATLTAIERFNPADVDGYRRFLAHSERVFELAFARLAEQPFHQLTSLLRHAPAMASLGAWRSVNGMVNHYLRDPHLRQAFSIPPLLVGGHPGRTTSIYTLIHYLERRWGVHYPEGGVCALVEALTRLLHEVGVQVHTDTTVARLEQGPTGALEAVALEGGERIATQRVVADCDPAYLYQKMLAPGSRRRWSPRRLARLTPSMGLFVLYFATTRPYPEVDQHTIDLGPRFDGLLDDIFDHGTLAEDFSLYLHRPGAGDVGMNGPGGDGFYALVPVPNLRADIDWEHKGPWLEQQVLARLEANHLPQLRTHLRHTFHITPRDFASRYLAADGSGFALAPLFTQSAWFRFHNRSEEVPGLYLVGAGTHPGAGLPGVLSSAKVLERLWQAEGG